MRRNIPETLKPLFAGAPLPSLLGLQRGDAPKVQRLAAALAQRGALDDALALARLATQLDDASPRAWECLGVIAARHKHHEEAVRALERVVKAEPQSVAAWTDLGEAKLTLLDYAGAVAAFEKVIALDPDAQHPHGRRARAVVGKTLQRLRSQG